MFESEQIFSVPETSTVNKAACPIKTVVTAVQALASVTVTS